jgi:membrane protease YdiL (CAAX protease family)
MNLIQGVMTFFVGLLAGFWVKKYQSIYPPIILHMLVNLWGVFT